MYKVHWFINASVFSSQVILGRKKKSNTHKNGIKTQPSFILLQILTLCILLNMWLIFSGSFYSENANTVIIILFLRTINKLMCEDTNPNIHYLIDIQKCYIALYLCTLSSQLHPSRLCFLLFSLSWWMSTPHTGENHTAIMKGLLSWISSFEM